MSETANASPGPRRGRVRGVVGVASLLAGVGGAVPAYGFGAQIGGALFGWVTALNGGVICALLAGAVLERAIGLWAGRGRTGR